MNRDIVWTAAGAAALWTIAMALASILVTQERAPVGLIPIVLAFGAVVAAVLSLRER